jgi:hypothetical protein
MLLVPATNVPGGDPAIVVATTIPGLRLQQGTVRRTLVQTFTAHTDDVTTAG